MFLLPVEEGLCLVISVKAFPKSFRLNWPAVVRLSRKQTKACVIPIFTSCLTLVLGYPKLV